MSTSHRLYIIISIIISFYSTKSFAQEQDTIVWSLEDCINYALENNISIRQNNITAESSYIDVLTAKANLFPNLSFSTSHNYVNRPLTEDGGVKKNSYNGNYGLNASWTVFNGGRNTKTIRQQTINSEISQLDVEITENSIIESIITLYIQILYAEESVKINENTLEVSTAQLDRARELLAVGSIARSDYAQLEAQNSNDKYNLVTSQTALENYKLQLKQLLELDNEEEINIYIPKLSDEYALQILPDKSEIYRTSMVLRPEIEARKLATDASELAIGIARAGYFPTISLSAGIGTSHTTGTDFTFAQQAKNGWNNSIGVTLSVPIFNNRETKSAVQKARLNYESSKLDLINEEKNLYRTIEGYWLDATNAQQRYISASENLRSAGTSYELVSEQFNLGMKNTVELLTEKNNLQSARQEVVQSKYMAILNQQLLDFYRGEIVTFE